MIAAALYEAARDTRLHKADVVLLVILHGPGMLDYHDERPVKRAFLLHRCRMEKTAWYEAMNRLQRHGYLVKGKLTGDPGRQVHTYRLANPPASYAAPTT